MFAILQPASQQGDDPITMSSWKRTWWDHDMILKDIERFWKWNEMEWPLPNPDLWPWHMLQMIRRSLQVFLFEDPSQLMSGSKHTSCCETYHIPHSQNGIGYIRYILILVFIYYIYIDVQMPWTLLAVIAFCQGLHLAVDLRETGVPADVREAR